MKDITPYLKGLDSEDLHVQYENCKAIREFLDCSILFFLYGVKFSNRADRGY
jgi:hypothetical protein